VRQLRLSIVGFGTVGRWVAAAIHRRRSWLEAECGVELSLVGVATRRDGFLYRDRGFDIPTLLAANGGPLAYQTGTHRCGTAIEGLTRTESDLLIEASNTNPREPEPALSHIRQALERGMHVVTSSKGACAAAALELAALARQHGVQCRMESTVMSGTPVLSTIREGLAGARILALRGILNGTANHVLTRMAEGLEYPAALADAQARGYAEPDPSDDVDGHDAVAKTRILAAVAFGRTIPLDQIVRHGIAEITVNDVHRAAHDGCRLKLIASIRPWAVGERAVPSSLLEARLEPLAVPLTDPLSRVDGVMNALTVETDTVPTVTIIGPGAGLEQAGQGAFADLVAILRGQSIDAPRGTQYQAT
jgi:homoserine dehydrogenase